MISSLHGAVFGRSFLRAMLGELGDKTFFLVVMLAAWCPWEGVRSDGRTFQQCLVFLGSTIALAVRIILLATLDDPNFHSWAFEVLACVLLLLMGLKAWIGIRTAANTLEEASAKKGHQAGDPEAVKQSIKTESTEPQWNNPFGTTEPIDDSSPAAEEGPTWNKEAFPFAPATTQQSTYGGVKEMTADGVLSNKLSDKFLSGILSFMCSCVLIFVAEADDKSESILVKAGRRGFDTALGAILGILPTIALAVLIGSIIERQLSAWHILSGVMATTFALTLISLSQALQHISVLNVGNSSELQLLQMLSVAVVGTSAI